MVLQCAIRELTVRLARLAEALLSLRVTAIEDRPRPAGRIIRLVDSYDDAVEEALGLSEEALEAAVQGQRAAERLGDPERVRRAVTACLERYNRLLQRFQAIVASDRELAVISHLGRERGSEWVAWVETLEKAVHACHAPLVDAGRMMACCCREIQRVSMV